MTTNKLRFVENEPPKNAEELVAAKKRLRTYMKGRRSENENRDVKETLLVENVLQALRSKGVGTGTDKRAFVYLSFSSEAPTDKLIETFLADGWTVFSPRVEGKKMVAVAYGEDFALSAFGAREPLGEGYDGDVDVAIVPMLAVDEQGRRLGYGGGYYDRYLGEHPETLKIAYGFDFQIMQKIPTEEHDIKMDGIVTDKRIVWTDGRAKK